MPQRPLSPHMSVYRMTRHTLLTSILNRLTGLALTAGLIVFVYWLMAVAGGSRAYAHAHQLLSLGIFKLLFGALLIAYCYHLVAGLRHLLWDTGRAMERSQAQRSAAVLVVVVAVLVVVLGYWLFFAAGRA